MHTHCHDKCRLQPTPYNIHYLIPQHKHRYKDQFRFLVQETLADGTFSPYTNIATVPGPGGSVDVGIDTINVFQNAELYVDNPQPMDGSYTPVSLHCVARVCVCVSRGVDNPQQSCP